MQEKLAEYQHDKDFSCVQVVFCVLTDKFAHINKLFAAMPTPSFPSTVYSSNDSFIVP